MQILLRDAEWNPLFTQTIDPDNPPATATPPPSSTHTEQLPLYWDAAFNDQHQLIRCPCCQSRELFTRRDFPQRLGLLIVVIAAVTALTLFALHLALLAFAVLAATALLDAVILLTVKKCLVCYRCRSEFRQTPLADQHKPWDLAIGEKYRQI